MMSLWSAFCNRVVCQPVIPVQPALSTVRSSASLLGQMKWEPAVNSPFDHHHRRPGQRAMHRTLASLVLVACLAIAFSYLELYDDARSILFRKYHHRHHKHRPHNADEIIGHCEQLKVAMDLPHDDFWKRSVSDRYEQGTPPVLIKNGKIWTGRKNGTQILHGDILLDKGLIKDVGDFNVALLEEIFGGHLQVVDVQGAWVTPGIVDIHSHIGDAPVPLMKGAIDAVTSSNIAAPWLRSLDGLNTHDESYPLSIAGGVTTALVLPGSEAAIGGQAYVIKLRETSERSPSAMLLEPPYHINTSFPNPNLKPRWRHMKHACGENPSQEFKGTRMDTIWAFREAYNTAKEVKERQDEFCGKVLSKKVDWRRVGEFPDPLKWEALVDVLRGRVKLHIHCYEEVDMDAMVRLSNEFKFPIAAFHHASEAYLVPDLLKKAYGKTPAVALFATAAGYKREAYRASEFAPKLLAKNGIAVSMKSDHPLMDSRHLLYEAQQAFYYGLPWNLAIASVTSTSAETMGLGHRIGYIKEGYDADVVVWDSHPLALGATPAQVFIDGVPQLYNPQVAKKPANYQRLPRLPKFDEEAEKAVQYDGLPPLEPKKATAETIVFTNVRQAMQRSRKGITSLFSTENGTVEGTVIVEKGKIVCAGAVDSCSRHLNGIEVQTVDLEGGSITPGFVSYGSRLGLQHVDAEDSTNDGTILDALQNGLPNVMGGDTAIVRAADGLVYASRDAYIAYRAGVTSAVVAPKSDGFFGGLGVHFSTGASSRVESGALLQEITALHISVLRNNVLGHKPGKPSVSTQIATLRRLLSGKVDGALGHFFQQVREGSLPLVIEAHNADIIATLITIKQQTEVETGVSIRMTITGASEAHLLAKELANARVGVILSPSRPFPMTWEQRRIMPGPPITKETALTVLKNEGVLVGLGCSGRWDARNLPFDITWAAIDASGHLTRDEAFAIGSSNIETLLGVERDPDTVDLVATKGGDLLDFHSKVVAIVSPIGKGVYLV
ncbi:amidohydrolase [Coprinopsis sp. MPI-PUGE-AT-0042]|nr:amidohydrolase [Coprinopsis sp. MPI-PUGE-AT-0042]